jgi:hypothetical protein
LNNNSILLQWIYACIFLLRTFHISITQFPSDISNTSCLKALQDCKNLRELNLKNNPLENSPHWRQQIKAILPFLQKLNGESL